MEVIDLTDEPQEPRTAPVVVRVKPIGIEYSIDVVDLLDEEENPGRTVPALPATGASLPSCDGEIIGGDDERLRMGSKTEGRRRHDDTTKNTTKKPSQYASQSIQTTHPQFSASMIAEVIDISSDESEAEIETGNGRSVEDQVSNSSLELKVFHRRTSLERALASCKKETSRDQGRRVRVRNRGIEHLDCSTIGVGVHRSPAQRRSVVKGCNHEHYPYADSSKSTVSRQQGIDAQSGSITEEAEFDLQSLNESSHKEGTEKAPIAKPDDSFTSERKSGAVQSYGNVVDPHPIPYCKDAIVSKPVHRGPANPLVKELSPADETFQCERNDIGLENAVRSRRKSATRTDKRSVTKRQKTIDLDSADDIPQCKIAGVCVNEPPLSAMPSRGSVPAKNAAFRQNDRESASKHVGRNGGIHVGEKPAARTRPAPPSRVPNFILIDDSRDVERCSVRLNC